MKLRELQKMLTVGGPGLSGYTWKAETYCTDCGEDVCWKQAQLHAETTIETDPDLTDETRFPQPIFYGEHDREVYCTECNDYLYGSAGEGEGENWAELEEVE